MFRDDDNYQYNDSYLRSKIDELERIVKKLEKRAEGGIEKELEEKDNLAKYYKERYFDIAPYNEKFDIVDYETKDKIDDTIRKNCEMDFSCYFSGRPLCEYSYMLTYFIDKLGAENISYVEVPSSFIETVNKKAKFFDYRNSESSCNLESLKDYKNDRIFLGRFSSMFLKKSIFVFLNKKLEDKELRFFNNKKDREELIYKVKVDYTR